MDTSMRTIGRVLAAGLLAALPALAAADGEGDIALREAPGRALVQARCVMCHSLDYIQMNSVFLDRAGWQKSVEKMINVMGAPLPPEEVAPIVDYLAAAYGTRPAAP